VALGGVLEFAGFCGPTVVADDQGNGFAADFDSGDLDVRFSQ